MAKVMMAAGTAAGLAEETWAVSEDGGGGSSLCSHMHRHILSTQLCEHRVVHLQRRRAAGDMGIRPWFPLKSGMQGTFG